MDRKDVYLDTNLWSRLLQQPSDDGELIKSLNARGVYLVMSDTVICELLQSQTVEMFSRLRNYTTMPRVILKNNMELLAAEMHAMRNGGVTIDPFLTAKDHNVYRAHIGRVAEGTISQEDRRHLAWRAERVTNNRLGQTQHMQDLPQLKSDLALIPQKDIEEWLDREALGRDGVLCLASNIHTYFHHPAAVEKPTVFDSLEWAQGLLASTSWRMPRAIVRRNLYMNWRSGRSRSSSVPLDLLIDTDHVLNAIFCDIYATEEARQEDYAALLLTKATKVRIYNREAFPMVADWLMAVLS